MKFIEYVNTITVSELIKRSFSAPGDPWSLFTPLGNDIWSFFNKADESSTVTLDNPGEGVSYYFSFKLGLFDHVSFFNNSNQYDEYSSVIFTEDDLAELDIEMLLLKFETVGKILSTVDSMYETSNKIFSEIRKVRRKNATKKKYL